MEMARFHYFLTAANEQNLQRAAQRLFISQQALSVHIQKLEEEYGVTLFERRPRLRLTPAGEKMRDYCMELFEMERKMAESLSLESREVAGKIYLGMSTLRARTFLPIIWERFHKCYPNVRLCNRDYVAISIEEQLQKGQFDCFVGVNTSNFPQFVSHPLTMEHACFAASRTMLEQCGVIPEDYMKNGMLDLNGMLQENNIPMVLMDTRFRYRTMVDQYFRQLHVIPKVVMECNSQMLMWQMAMEKYGACFASPALLYGPFRGKIGEDIFLYSVPEEILASRIDALFLPKFEQDGYKAAFLQTVIDVFGEYDRNLIQPFERGEPIW